MLIDPLTPVIVFLVKSAVSWLPAIGGTLLNSDIEKGQQSLFGWITRWQTKRTRVQHLKVALQKAAEQGIHPFQTPGERDQYRSILAILSQPGFYNEELRRESLRLFTLSDSPDLKALSDIYNRARRIETLSQAQASTDVDASPYLVSFFSALLDKLYNDEVFGPQVREVLNARAAKTTQQRLPQIAEGIQELVVGVRQLLQATTLDYTSDQFEQDVTAYLSYVERTYDSLKLPSVIPEESGDRDAELNAIFVSPHVALQEPTQSGTLQYASILALLKHSPYVVLLGGPGSGKSTITRYLAWSHAAARLPSNAALLDNIPLLPGKPVPLRVELHDFSEIRAQYPDTSIFVYTTEIVLGRMAIDVNTHMFDVLLKQNALLFLFDGLDEIADSDERRTLIDMIEDIAQRYRGNSILVTSRPVGYELFGFSKRWFTHAIVQELDDEQIHQFLELWYNRVLQLAPLPYEDQKELALLYETLKGNPRLHTLARNPLLLTIITTLHRTERLPDRRVHVYDRCADLLLDTWSRRRGTNERWQDMQMTRDVQRACLAHLGFVLYERFQEREKDTDSGAGVFNGDCLTLTQMQTEVEFFLKSRQLFSPEERQIEAERFLELMRTETGLIVKRGRDESGEDLYGFIHRTFQEYFAALDIYFRQADPPHPDLPGENANTILNTFLTSHLHDPYWQEVILLLFGKLGPVRATIQIQMILNPPDGRVCCRSNYTEIIQQDLFFACACLQEEITVQNNLTREIVARLSKLIQTSPFPSQRVYAIDALAALLKTQQYSQLGRTTLLDLMTQDTLSTSIRIQVAQILCRSMSPTSELKVQAQQMLTDLLQQPESSAWSAIQAAQALYECYPNASPEQLQAVQMMLDATVRHQLSFEQTIQIMRTFLQRPSISDEIVRLISHTLLQRLEHTEVSLEQARLLVDALSYSATIGSLNDWESAADRLLAILQNNTVPFKKLVTCTYILYQALVKSDRRLQAAQHLLNSADRSTLSIEEIIDIGGALSWNDHDEADERQRIIALLTNTLQRSELSFEQTLQLLETLYGCSPNGSNEQQQAIQQILQLTRQTHLPFEEKVQAIEVLYRCSPLNSRENLQAVDMLLAIAQASDLRVEEAIEIFQRLYDYDLAVSIEGQEALQILVRFLQKPDLSQRQQIQVAQDLYEASFPRSANREQAIQVLWKWAQDATLPTKIRLEATKTPLMVGDANYPDRAHAVQIILTLKQKEEARTYLEQHWQPVLQHNRVEPSDVPALIELLQQDVLPMDVRDEIYRILKQMVPQFGNI
ncbi:MAG: NACHT domain-containing protein [Ktedonobacteraceae bacterium]|nr:NACHT domain-containing protein [Ktedonobacteraceae bacterium]